MIISSSVCWFPMHSNLKLRRVFDSLRCAEDNAKKDNIYENKGRIFGKNPKSIRSI